MNPVHEAEEESFAFVEEDEVDEWEYD